MRRNGRLPELSPRSDSGKQIFLNSCIIEKISDKSSDSESNVSRPMSGNKKLQSKKNRKMIGFVSQSLRDRMIFNQESENNNKGQSLMLPPIDRSQTSLGFGTKTLNASTSNNNTRYCPRLDKNMSPTIVSKDKKSYQVSKGQKMEIEKQIILKAKVQRRNLENRFCKNIKSRRDQLG